MSHHDYPALAKALGEPLKKLRQEIPQTMQAFGDLNKAAHGDESVLDNKQKELIAMAIGVAIRCQGCLAFHAKALVAEGCSRAEFLEMLKVAIYMGGGPSLMTAAEALAAYESFGGEQAPA